MHKRFHNKTVIITGAGSGIGRATAIQMAQEGANVVLIGRTKERLLETLDMLPEESSWIHDTAHLTVTCDITQQHQVEQMVTAVAERYEHIDVLINNVGRSVFGTVTEVSAKSWQQALDVNLTGTFYVSQSVMPHLIKSKGNIVNVSALSGMGGDWKMSAHDVAKAGVTNLTRMMALDYGHQGVRVNAVSPGITETQMTAELQADSVKTEAYLSRCPLGKIVKPIQVASAITFLASDDANMITGVDLPVDGGMNASFYA